jgi:serine/threonine-protein kinase RsbW
LAADRRMLVDEQVDDLKLAVSEACTNAVEAHRRAGTGVPIRVLVFEMADRIEVHVIDHGGGFDPLSLPPHPRVTDPDRLNFERGLGVPLIRSLVDEVEFTRSGPGMTVRMVLFSSALAIAPAEPLPQVGRDDP